MAPEPVPDLRFGLLDGGDRGSSLHRAGARQPRDSFLRAEFAPLADFSLSLRIRLGSLLVPVIIHGFPFHQAPRALKRLHVNSRSLGANGRNGWKADIGLALGAVFLD